VKLFIFLVGDSTTKNGEQIVLSEEEKLDRIEQTAKLLTAASSRVWVALFNRGWTPGSLIRKCLENEMTYSDVMSLLADNNTRLVVPCYFVCSGSNKGEGAVITYGHTHQPKLRVLNVDSFILQTNDDVGTAISPESSSSSLSAPPTDFHSDERYQTMFKHISTRCSQARMSPNEAALLCTTSLKKGGCRVGITLYAAVMIPHADKEDDCFHNCKASRPIGPS
jgi:hypothetical protein